MSPAILWVLVLSYCNHLTMGTLLAAAGYLASSPRVRDFLIRTGIAQEIHNQGQILYDFSGFRFAGDQGNGKREASLLTHDLVEISDEGVKETNRNVTILRRHKRDYPYDESEYLERLFGLLQKMDGNTCISRLLCEIGQDSKPFGVIGRKVTRFLRSLPPVKWNSPIYEYLDAFKVGYQQGMQQCREYFDACAYDLRRVMGVLWLLLNYPLHLG